MLYAVLYGSSLSMQAQQSAALHAKQAQQAREEAEQVRRQAADSIRQNSVAVSHLREVAQLGQNAALAEEQATERVAELERWKAEAPVSAGMAVFSQAVSLCM
jgi:L-lactate utilization protein LutC